MLQRFVDGVLVGQVDARAHGLRNPFGRGRFPRRASALLAFAASLACAQPIQLDPFAQATDGDRRCPAQPPPLLSAEEARVEAHVRVERGLRCAMEGKCESGGAYRRDPEINARVRDMIASDPRFAATSVWVTTSRKWVTLQGCVRDAAQRKALVAFVAHAPDVERVFDELTITRRTGRR
ncbi:MAG TPA: BON domain-containing protein [Casimicrobiaceae bacterium]